MSSFRNHFGVIIADPPWTYNQTPSEGSAIDQYDTMTVDAICSMPVEQLAMKDSVLLLWVTWPTLPEGMQVMSAWGFKYVTGFPWVKVSDVARTLQGDIEFKVRYGVGFWIRGASEPILIGRRGSPKIPDEHFVGLLSPNFAHSRKPDDIYEYAEACQGPRLELFARRPRDGWTVWGNEVRGSTDVFAGL